LIRMGSDVVAQERAIRSCSRTTFQNSRRQASLTRLLPLPNQNRRTIPERARGQNVRPSATPLNFRTKNHQLALA
jgi:hypothetical protein